jgi:hypothetical protein
MVVAVTREAAPLQPLSPLSPVSLLFIFSIHARDKCLRATAVTSDTVTTVTKSSEFAPQVIGERGARQPNGCANHATTHHRLTYTENPRSWRTEYCPFYGTVPAARVRQAHIDMIYSVLGEGHSLPSLGLTPDQIAFDRALEAVAAVNDNQRANGLQSARKAAMLKALAWEGGNSSTVSAQQAWGLSMSSLRPTIVIFCCLACHQAYEATQERYPYERPGRFDCIECNAEVHAWSGFFDYTGWKALALSPAVLEPGRLSPARRDPFNPGRNGGTARPRSYRP